jgi:hypothetical protein
VPPVPASPLPTAACFAGVLTLAARQRDQFRADGLGDSIQLTLAQVRLEEFHIGALHAHDGEARPSISFTYVPTLTHKDFSHLFRSFPVLFWVYAQNYYRP